MHDNLTQARHRAGKCVFQGLHGVRVAASLANPPRWEPYGAVKLVDGLAGESPASADRLVGTVVISGDGAGDQTVESPVVEILAGGVQTRSDPSGG